MHPLHMAGKGKETNWSWYLTHPLDWLVSHYSGLRLCAGDRLFWRNGSTLGCIFVRVGLYRLRMIYRRGVWRRCNLRAEHARLSDTRELWRTASHLGILVLMQGWCWLLFGRKNPSLRPGCHTRRCSYMRRKNLDRCCRANPQPRSPARFGPVWFLCHSANLTTRSSGWSSSFATCSPSAGIGREFGAW